MPIDFGTVSIWVDTFVRGVIQIRWHLYQGKFYRNGISTGRISLKMAKVNKIFWSFFNLLMLDRYPVSNFSYRLLDQMMSDPLFQVNDLNPLLYRRIKQLDKTRLLRTKLFFLKDFLFACRFATRWISIFFAISCYEINKIWWSIFMML